MFSRTLSPTATFAPLIVFRPTINGTRYAFAESVMIDFLREKFAALGIADCVVAFKRPPPETFYDRYFVLTSGEFVPASPDIWNPTTGEFTP